MYKSFSMELAGRTLTVDVGRVAKQANGAAFMHYGDTVVLSTATASEKPRDGIDFFPLSVEYEEKMYAVGKIPGGFNKREGKASEHAILTSRVIDRPMRPLFPKDYRNDVTLNNMVMSVDPECDPEVVAMLGSAIATCISDIPFDGPCAMTQIGMIDGEFIVNPTLAQKAVSDLKLTVASTREKVIMIEAGAKEIPEAKMIDAIYKAHEVNQEIIKFIDSIVAEVGKPKHAYESCAIPEELFAAIKEIVTPEQMEELVDSQQWKQLFGEEEAQRRSTGSSQETEEKMQVIQRIQKEKRNNPGVNAITIDQKLVYEETEHHIKTRIPYRKNEFIWLDKSEISWINDHKTIFAGLEKKKEYAILDLEDRFLRKTSGEDLYRESYDPVHRERARQEQEKIRRRREQNYRKAQQNLEAGRRTIQGQRR